MPRRSRDQVAASRAAILEASVAQASVRGFEAASIGSLATSLGMSKSGVVGHFGDKEQLQLATLEAGIEQFVAEVWRPVERAHPPGTERLLALCDAWTAFHERGTLPGGCLLTTASVEFDARPGPVRDAVALAMRRWLGLIEREAAALEPSAGDPADVAFTLNALASAASTAFLLHGDPAVFARARRLMRAAVHDAR
jgi:AcrR family transcriptional regulator